MRGYVMLARAAVVLFCLFAVVRLQAEPMDKDRIENAFAVFLYDRDHWLKFLVEDTFGEREVDDHETVRRMSVSSAIWRIHPGFILDVEHYLLRNDRTIKKDAIVTVVKRAVAKYYAGYGDAAPLFDNTGHGTDGTGWVFTPQLTRYIADECDTVVMKVSYHSTPLEFYANRAQLVLSLANESYKRAARQEPLGDRWSYRKGAWQSLDKPVHFVAVFTDGGKLQRVFLQADLVTVPVRDVDHNSKLADIYELGRQRSFGFSVTRAIDELKFEQRAGYQFADIYVTHWRKYRGVLSVQWNIHSSSQSNVDADLIRVLATGLTTQPTAINGAEPRKRQSLWACAMSMLPKALRY